MSHDNTYAILTPIPSANAGIWKSVVQERSTVRKSLDGLSCVVKWPVGEAPTPEEVLRAGGVTYTHEEILRELEGPRWTAPEESR